MAALSAVFLDTSALLGGLIDFGNTVDAQRLLDGVAQGKLSKAHTAWHCCLEFFSVATRLPEEYRLTPEDALLLVEEEIFARLQVHQLPEAAWTNFLRSAAADGIVGGRIYDAHIAEVARSSGCQILVTENKGHFLSLLRPGISVLTAAEVAVKLDL